MTLKSSGLPPRTAVPDEQQPLETTEHVFFARQIPPPVQPSLCPEDKAVKGGPRCSCLSILPVHGKKLVPPLRQHQT